MGSSFTAYEKPAMKVFLRIARNNGAGIISWKKVSMGKILRLKNRSKARRRTTVNRQNVAINEAACRSAEINRSPSDVLRGAKSAKGGPV